MTILLVVLVIDLNLLLSSFIGSITNKLSFIALKQLKLFTSSRYYAVFKVLSELAKVQQTHSLA